MTPNAIFATVSLICLFACQYTSGSSNPSYASWTWGERLSPKYPYADYQKKTYREKSFHEPEPFRRPDGTTKSRVFGDTLMREELTDFEDSFTSLDAHLKEMSGGKKQTYTNPDRVLGDLDPQEVYYADDDLLIIKGGGFQSPTYEEPPQEIRPREEDQIFSTSFYNPSPPSRHEEYNGNIPTIVKPPTNYRNKQVASTQYSPFALFVPAGLFPRETGSYYFYVPYLPPTSYNYVMDPTPYPYWNRPSSNLVQSPLKRPNKQYVSLLGDTNVNYLHPRPSQHPDAEFLTDIPRRNLWEPKKGSRIPK